MMAFDQPQTLALRPYQEAAIDALRAQIRCGRRRLILSAATGSGKTVIASKLLGEAARKGSYSLFIVDRVTLVDQTSAVLDSYGLPHGIVQGINPRWHPHEHVQVCSAQTLARRSLPREPALIIVDEAHVEYKATLAYLDRHPQAVKIGLTATPFTSGMADHWDGIIDVRPARRLIEDGHLVEPVIYIAKAPDDADLGLNSYGEFSDASATAAGIRIIGDVVAEWIGKVQEHFDGPVKTIVFSPTVEHGRELCAAFNAAGYNFQQISYMDKNDAERAAKIAEFRRPDSVIVGLVSCGVLTRGFDVPDCLVGISCKPYRKSLSGHMQEVGRVMRPAPGKEKSLWLDHAGNIERFGTDMLDIWENGAGDLLKAERRDAVARKRDDAAREAIRCPECGGIMRGLACLACGYERRPHSGIVAIAGELRLFDPQTGIAAREGLRAKCLDNPRVVWDAALSWCTDRQPDIDRARRWAYGIWRGIYPDAKLPRGCYEAQVPVMVDPAAYQLIGREVARFRRRKAA